MRVRPFLSSTALIAALMLSSSLSSPALAQKGIISAPSTDWAVNQVEGQGGGAGYCALARRYNQNMILTLAKNPAMEMSFALDFQRPKFNVARYIDVVLDPGAGEQRTFNVQPVSNKAFVVRLGRDGPFFDALKRTGHLRAEVDGYSYAFNVSDIDFGQKQLDTCISNVSPTGAGTALTSQDLASSPSSLPDNVSMERSRRSKYVDAANTEIKLYDLEQEVEQLEDVKHELLKNNQELKLQLQRQELDYLTRIDTMRRDLDEQVKRNEQMMGEFELAEKEWAANVDKAQQKARETNEKLRQNYEKLQADRQAEIEALQAELNLNRSENVDLKLALQTEKQKYSDDLSEAKLAAREASQVVSNFEQDHKAVLARLESLTLKHDTVSADLRAALDENSRLKTEIQSGKTDYLTEVSELRSKLAEQQKAMEKLSMALAQAEEAQKSGSEEALKWKLEAEDYNTKLKEYETENQTLMAKLEAEQKRAQELASTLLQKETSQSSQVALLQQETKELSRSLEDQKLKSSEEASNAQEWKKKAEEYSELLNKVQKENEEALTKLASYEGKNQEVLANLEAKKAEAAKLAAKLEEEKALQQTQMSEAERWKAEAEKYSTLLETYKTENAQTIAQLEKKQREAENLAATVDGLKAEQSAEAQKWKAQAEEYAQLLEKYKTENAEISAKLEAKGTTEDTLTADLEKALEEKNKLSSELESTRSALQSQLAEVQAKLDAQGATGETLSTDLEKTLADNKKLSAEIENARSSYDKQLGELQAQLDALRKEKEELNVALNDYKAGRSEAEQKAQAELAEARSRNEQLQQEMASLTSKLEGELATLKTRLETSEAEAEKLQTALSEGQSVEDQYKAVVAERDDLQAALQGKETEYKGVIEELREKLAAQAAESEELRAALEQGGQQTPETEALMAENKALKQQLNKAEKEYMAHLDELRAKAQEKDARLAALEEEKSEILAATETSATGSNLDEKVEGYQKQLAEIQVERDRLKERVGALEALSQQVAADQSGHDDARIAELNTKIEQLSAVNDSLEDDLRKAYAQADEIKSSSASSNEEKLEYQKKIAALQEELERSEAQKEQAIRNLTRQYDQMKAEAESEAERRREAEAAADQGKALAAAKVAADKAASAAATASAAVSATKSAASAASEKAASAATKVAEAPRAASSSASRAAEDDVQKKALSTEDILDAGQEAAQKTSQNSTVTYNNAVTEAQKQEQALASQIRSKSEDLKQAIQQEELKSATRAEAQSVQASAPDLAADLARIEQETLGARARIAEQAPAGPAGVYEPSFGLEGLLEKSSVSSSAKMKLVENASSPQKRVYQWMTGNNVYGSSEQSPMKNAGEFEARVQDYLEKTKKRCVSDFAILPDRSVQNGGTRVDTYEVACVGSGTDSSASLVFFNKGETFTVVAHEAPTDNMDAAMSIRDRVAKTAAGS